MGIGRRIAGAVGCSALCFGVLVASADVAEAGTVRQRSRVVDSGTAVSNSDGNVVVPNRSTSTGGTSTSTGTATVSSGTATATGSTPWTYVRQSSRRR